MSLDTLVFFRFATAERAGFQFRGDHQSTISTRRYHSRRQAPVVTTQKAHLVTIVNLILIWTSFAEAYTF